MNRSSQHPIGPENNGPHDNRPQLDRPIMIVIFAIAIILVAGRASAHDAIGTCDCPNTFVCEHSAAVPIQLDGETFFVQPAETDASRHSESTNRQVKPRYAIVAASLANFDADAAADGWRAEVALMNDKDQPVTPRRAHAAFELTSGFDEAPMRWSVPLEFDDRGVAVARLPASSTFRNQIQAHHWFSDHGSSRRNSSFHGAERHRRFLVDPLDSRLVGSREQIGVPGRIWDGRLSVRVSVPSAGVFSAGTLVPIDTAAFLDTFPAYR
ncbi:hypothetical protein [Rubripirellula reticaptiva]|uniref:SWIM-type domain-containing protein n=1 Tax=Rubripirellula reticaptiva TaxID=2528013 RepID=A0A5C6EN08_9BACT|nr:hypothetical protein [Rubripirellula reticaptiva]TWU49790.1 hypothetical protein Poly59_44150 [Rubripirellula reticaptiva]